MIGYYVHHQGRGHLTRAQAVSAHLGVPVTALTSLTDVPAGVFDEVVRLPRDDHPPIAGDVTAAAALHWVPPRHGGLRERMAAVSAWIAAARPAAMVVDVSVEIALLARLHGIPVIGMVLPGNRIDPPHVLVHRIAEALIAAWPGELYRPGWLRAHEAKTHYVGGVSRFAPAAVSARSGDAAEPTILVVAGAGGCGFSADSVRACARRYPQYRWCAAGLDGWVDDLWPALRRADIVVAQAGQGIVADLAAARAAAIVIPGERPFGEQRATAGTLAAAGLTITADRWPAVEQWPELIDRTRRIDRDRWRLWRTEGAAERAAAVITAVIGPGRR